MRQHDSTDNAFVYDSETPTVAAQRCGLDVDALAQEIRRVDGNNRLGAGALAEALQCAQPQAGEPVADEREWCKLYHSRWPTEDLLKAREPGGLITDDGEAWKYHYTHSDAQGGPYDLVYRPVASPQPANPAQVTDKRSAWLAEAKYDALIEEAKDFSERMTSQPWACELIERLLAALTAAIGAGEQAVAGEPIAWQNIETPSSILTPDEYEMRLPFAEGRFLPLYAHLPHPADERVVEDWREIEQQVQPRLADGYTAVAISKPGFWKVKGPGPAAALAQEGR